MFKKKAKKIDPICGMEGTLFAYGYYFCSPACIRKYEELHNIKESYCPECVVKERKWYKEKIFLVVIALLIIQISHLILNALGIKILHHLVLGFYGYLEMVWLPILIGILIGGIIDYFVPREYIIRYLAQPKKRTIFYSVGLGFLASACSHGILAISMELYKKGASIPAVISFLLASPWANLPMTILLFGFFKFKAFLFVTSAIIIAFITGFIYQVLEKKGWIEKNSYSVENKEKYLIKTKNYNLINSIIGILRGSWDLARMVLWWILIGLFLASLIKAFVPKSFFMNFMGPNLLGLVITLIFATIIEICSEGSAPVAFEIFRQTQAFGNSLVFLMAGVVTDYTEIGLIWSNIGKKSALLLPLITVPQVLILGYLFNILL